MAITKITVPEEYVRAICRLNGELSKAGLAFENMVLVDDREEVGLIGACISVKANGIHQVTSR